MKLSEYLIEHKYSKDTDNLFIVETTIELDCISELTNLEKIFMDEVVISQKCIDKISDITTLKSLVINKSNVKIIDVSKLVNLAHLNLCDNKITKINVINLKKIKNLTLSNNKIKYLELSKNMDFSMLHLLDSNTPFSKTYPLCHRYREANDLRDYIISVNKKLKIQSLLNETI